MEKVVECPCGAMVRAADDEELVRQTQGHASEVHDMELSREQVLEMAHPA
jgi:predicted small metal-binding protein